MSSYRKHISIIFPFSLAIFLLSYFIESKTKSEAAAFFFIMSFLWFLVNFVLFAIHLFFHDKEHDDSCVFSEEDSADNDFGNQFFYIVKKSKNHPHDLPD